MAVNMTKRSTEQSTELVLNRIAVIGLGYIGLPTAASLAVRGIDVVGVDIDERVVDAINSGRIHISEPELDILVRSATNSKKLKALVEPEFADAFIIAVPTPITDDKVPDLIAVKSAAYSIAPVLRPGNLIVLESTVPVGGTETLSRWLSEARPDLTFPHQQGSASDIRIAYCPERVLPGQIVRELVENDRVVGGLTASCTRVATSLYKIFVQGDCLETTARTAELVKLTENAFRDVNIAFANELSLISHQEGVDVWELIKLANRHPRVQILDPGAGVGGHCIALDPWFIVSSVPSYARLIRCARDVNDSKPAFCVERILEECSSDDAPVCLAGLAFKPNVEDLRESPALAIAREVAARHRGLLYLVEPYIDMLPNDLAEDPKISLVSLSEGISKSSLLAILVRHNAVVEYLADNCIDQSIKVIDFVNAVRQ